MPKVIPEQKARQGRQGRPVLYVLIAALALAAIAWAGAEFYGKSIDNSPVSTSTPAAG